MAIPVLHGRWKLKADKDKTTDKRCRPVLERKYRLFPNLGRTLGKIIRGELRGQSSSFTAALDPVKEIRCADAPGTLSKPAPEKTQEFLQAKEPQTDTPPFGEMASQIQIDAVNQEWAERWSKK